MKKILTSLLAAVTLGTALIATAGSASADPWRRPGYTGGYHGGYYRGGYNRGWRGDRGFDPGAAAAAGLVGGLLLGGLAAQSAQPGYYYEDEPVVVRRRPVRVYEDTYVRRNRVTRCNVIIKHDMYGKPYEYKDCAP